MALRSTTKHEGPDFDEVLTDLEGRLDRLKRLYEQYFMGIQKIPPSQLHKEVERGIRELTQRQPRRTALRYRLTTLSQRFGAYNTYWNRVLRQIEQGTYVRDIARVKRRAYARGEEIPDEVLAKMPALMRKRVMRDRERLARRHEGGEGAASTPAQARGPEGSGSQVHHPQVHHIDESDPLLGADLDTDMEALFSAITAEEPPASAGAAGAPAAGDDGDARVITDGAHAGGEASVWREPGSGDVAAPPTRGRARPAARPAEAAAEGGWREPAKAEAREALAREQRRASTAGPGSSDRSSAKDSGGANLPPGMDADKARVLYDKYVRARRMVGADGDVGFDKLMGKLRDQAPRIMKEHRAAGVEFNVVLKDNRVVVKATPKK